MWRESYVGKVPVAEFPVHVVSQMLKDACFSRYLLAFIPFSNDESVLKLYFLCDPSNGILSATGFHLGKKKITVLSFTSLYIKTCKSEVTKMSID